MSSHTAVKIRPMKPTAPCTTQPAISTTWIPRFTQIAHGRPWTPPRSTSTIANPIRYPAVRGVNPWWAAATTGSASSTTMASSISVPAMTPRKLFQGSGPFAGAGCSVIVVTPPPALRAGGPTACEGRTPTRRRGSFGVLSEQRARGAGGDDRTGDHHARAAEPFALVAGLLDERRGGFDRVGECGRGDHPLRPEPLLGAQGQRFDVECAR